MTKLLRRGETVLPPSHQLWGDLLFLRRNVAFSAVPRQLVTGVDLITGGAGFRSGCKRAHALGTTRARDHASTEEDELRPLPAHLGCE